MEKELVYKIDQKMFQAVEELENVDGEEEISEYADSKNLIYTQLVLIRKLFQIYDEGDFECLVTIQMAIINNQHLKMDNYQKFRIVNVEKGGSI